MQESEMNRDSNDGEQWYLAQLIQVFTCETWNSQRVYINYVLLKAIHDEAAFEKAMRMGKLYSGDIRNSDDELITTSFAGLRELFSLGPELFDGLELFYKDEHPVSSEMLSKMITPKSELRIFRTKTWPQTQSDYVGLLDSPEE